MIISTSCVNRPKVTDGTNFLLIKKELVKIISYKEMLKSHEESFMTVSEFYNSQLIKPKSHLKELSVYLEKNDCLKIPESKRNHCYRITRLMLIQANKALDNAESKIYYLNRSISVLRGNIKIIIDHFPEINY